VIAGKRTLRTRPRGVHRAAKKNPGQLKQSGGSNTSRDNVVRQLLAEIHGHALGLHIVSGRGERIAALLGGHVNIM